MTRLYKAILALALTWVFPIAVKAQITTPAARATAACTLNFTVTATPTVLCSGKNATLTASGADTYSWSTGGTTSVITVAPSSNTSYTVMATNTLSGCTGTQVITLTVSPSPNVSTFAGNTTVCKGGFVNLLALGANTYTWSNGITTASIYVTPSVTTVFTVIGTSTAGCTGTASALVLVNNPPTVALVATATMVCEGQQVTLSASGASSYSWATPGGPLTGTAITVTINSPATYVVSGSDANNCTASAQVYISITDCTGLTENSRLSASIFPNPAGDKLTITSGADLKALFIYDVNGRLLVQQDAGGRTASLDLSQLPMGLYLLHATTVDGAYRTRLVKE